jgi:PE-PPE domain
MTRIHPTLVARRPVRGVRSSRRTASVYSAAVAGGVVIGGAASMLWLGALGVPVAVADPGDPVVPNVNDALVLIPLANQDYANAADQLYLAPSGFDGTAAVFITPDTGGEVANVGPGVQALVSTIEADYTAGDLSAADPLYVFGYSEGAVDSGLAEQQLHDFGIPASDLHFVMVGDSASAEGGYLNTVVDSFPEAQQASVTTFLEQLGLTPPVLGATTPDDLYPTDVYDFSGDGWAYYDNGANDFGAFTEHLAYLGLTPAQIASASEVTDGMTNYYTIDSNTIDFTTALYNQLLISLDIAPTTPAAETASATATADTPPDLAGADQTVLAAGQQLLTDTHTLLTTDLSTGAGAETLTNTLQLGATDLATLTADLHTLSTDLTTELLTALAAPDLLLP